MSSPTIVLTSGEPAGIGPDLCVQLAQNPPANLRVVVMGDATVLQDRAQRLSKPLILRPYDLPHNDTPLAPGELNHIQIDTRCATECGRETPDNADYVLDMLRAATTGCVEGRFAAMVTGPINKAIINDAGTHFSGHTEFLAQLTHATSVMMLATDDLRVALVTTHLPLSAVSAAITKETLAEVIEIVHSSLQTQFGIASPHILVCGLNPHAGEGGHLGSEEITTISPVIEALRAQGMNLSGPLPADTVFTKHRLADADAVIAMYHDQGLPVLKHAGFGRAVNVTLGLPIIRTSVDHGTACDLAGTGKADAGSLYHALDMAALLSRHGQHHG
jgi:4-hydroxythreonine-4-phosphate dehydrogenase